MALQHDLERALDARCRLAVRAYRVDAFDNIDVERLLDKEQLSLEDAQWIGRHLMENGRALAVYHEGQQILVEAARAR